MRFPQTVQDGQKMDSGYHLEETWFNINNIDTGSQGNKSCVISNLKTNDSWTRVGFYSNLKNEKNFLVQIWGLAKYNI